MNDPIPADRFDELVFRRLDQALLFDGSANKFLWITALVLALGAGLFYVAWMYRRDTLTIRWPWAAALGLVRACVYGILAWIFLLPAIQSWERVQKHSRVLVLVDVSGSMGVPDAQSDGDGVPFDQLPTRLDEVVKLLTDDEAKFLPRLLEKNPVAVYRFGTRLDEEPWVLQPGGELPAAADWAAWLKYDLKAWLLRGLSANGQSALRATPAFSSEKPGDFEWASGWLALDPNEALPASLFGEALAADRDALLTRRARLGKRLDAARELPRGTDVGKSLQALLDAESANMVAGVVLFSDGRSDRGADLTADLRARAHKEGVPVFTVGIGTDRPPVQLRITDLQVPDQTVPDEPFPVRVGLDGVGLAGAETTAALDLYKPGADSAGTTLTAKVTFPADAAGTPHADVEFTIDPDKVPEDFKAVPKDAPKPPPGQTAKKMLLEGTWKVAVRVPRAKGERTAEKEHATQAQPVQVLRKPLRVLLFAGGPTHDYQFVRTLLAREAKENRAELSIYLQNDASRQKDEAPDDESALKVEYAQDVDNERLLPRFPNKFVDAPPPAPKEPPLPTRGVKTESPYMNLARYDVILAFDPDWSKLAPEQMQLLERWVRTGGGLVVVGGPIYSYQMKRRLLGEESLKILQSLYPVRPGDSVVAGGDRRGGHEPHRLNFVSSDAELTFLKLDEESPDPRGGWTDFFMGASPRGDGKPVRGFYSPYPVESLTPGARTVATYADPLYQRGDQELPYVVTLDVTDGRSVYLGSGETYRLRQYKEIFFDRFWLKLSRYAAVASLKKKSRRGVLVVSKQYPADSVAGVKAKLLDASGLPLPPETAVKAVLIPPGAEGDRSRRREFALKGERPPPGPDGKPGKPSGWFQGGLVVDAVGEYQLEVTVPETGEPLKGHFTVVASNRELENTRPDFTALFQLAGDLEEVEKRNPDKAAKAKLQDAVNRARALAAPSSAGDPSGGRPTKRLFLDPAGSALAPDWMTNEVRQQNVKVGVRDIWDRGPTFSLGDSGPIQVPWLLILAVGLLSAEWLTRKLLRLA